MNLHLAKVYHGTSIPVDTSLEGTFAFEEQNGTKSSLRPGEVKHIGPDVGHTVRNEGSTAAKVLVVRVKEKAKPVAVPFQR